jgi:hypothetical protein
LREAAVASALVETTGAGGAVRRMATARRTRARAAVGPTRRMSALSAAAALVVALGVGGWLLSQSRGTADRASTSNGANLAAGQPVTKSANPGPEKTTEDAIGQTDPKRNASDQNLSAASSGIYNAGDIGDYRDTAPILERYRQYAAGVPAEEGSYLTASPCPKPDDRDVVWHAELTFNGIEAYARILMKDQSDQVLEVLSRADCSLVASQAI